MYGPEFHVPINREIGCLLSVRLSEIFCAVSKKCSSCYGVNLPGDSNTGPNTDNSKAVLNAMADRTDSPIDVECVIVAAFHLAVQALPCRRVEVADHDTAAPCSISFNEMFNSRPKAVQLYPNVQNAPR